MNHHFNHVRRVLSCNIEALTAEQGKELTAIIEKKVKAYAEVKAKADAKAKAKSSSTGGDSGAKA